MTDLAAIGAVWEYWKSGDLEVLARYIENGGSLDDREIRVVIVEYLRGSKPRRRKNWSRDRSIIDALRMYRRGHLDGIKHTLEESCALVSEIDGWPDEDRIQQIWKDRKR
jgi:hypothetical protein